MLKKIITAAFYLAFLAALVYGGVIRTQSVMGITGTDASDTNNVAEPGIVETTSSEWVTLEGTVQSWQDSTLTVITDTGALILIEGRGGRYLEENTFFVNTGDRVTMTGFYEGEAFEVATITSQVTGVSIRLRGEDGRPVWGSGGGGQ
jgi:hypothetical protein